MTSTTPAEDSTKNQSCSLTFLGDLACPDGLLPSISGSNLPLFRNCVINLEGPIVSDNFFPHQFIHKKNVRLYNSRNVIEFLKQWNVRVTGLASNHILDLETPPSQTASILAENDIVSCGAGDNIQQASKPAKIVICGREIIFLAFGWHVIQCRDAANDAWGTNPLRDDNVLNQLRSIRTQNPEAMLVLLMHWCYECERYPLPMHRRLAFKSIDAGANAVIGHHPHCAQGIEIYNGAPIVYSLGNWFLPQGDWFGDMITYPDYTADQLAFEWDPFKKRSKAHWFQYDKQTHGIVFCGSEEIESGEKIASLTPFKGLDHETYAEWFRQNRCKRTFLPVYLDGSNKLTNSFFDSWIKIRHAGILMLKKLRFKP